MRVDWESLKVSSCTLNTPHHNISQQLRSGQRNYTTTLFTLCRKIFASVLDKIFLHWIFCTVCHIPHVLSYQMLTPARQQVRGKASPSPGFRLSCLNCGKEDAKDPSAILLVVTETESLSKQRLWGKQKGHRIIVHFVHLPPFYGRPPLLLQVQQWTWFPLWKSV